MKAAVDTGAVSLDADCLRDLRALMGDDFTLLVSTYLEDLECRRRLLAAARRENDLASLGAQAHALKGASRNIGALRMAELCEAIERLAGQGAGNRVDALLGLLGEEAERLGEALGRGEAC